MEIKKETVTTLLTTDGQEIKLGDMCMFETQGRPIIARFGKIVSRGNLMFVYQFPNSENVAFTVNPKAIKKIYKVKMEALSNE